MCKYVGCERQVEGKALKRIIINRKRTSVFNVEDEYKNI
jgi:hypothetical protein